jgi:hypothetical protein
MLNKIASLAGCDMEYVEHTMHGSLIILLHPIDDNKCR